ncbi:hypothetical protein ILUMI_02621 [Ignelater luminosus]|uniref:28S ribosomal protein S22, mitochondrial n=1 Tax=Ignelater luminosus TaxID=2038154 RepID=A0A8K0DCE2_IGNLU|nr:hypothetical protein ILUMI_02621 [Ignelater luminosus]
MSIFRNLQGILTQIPFKYNAIYPVHMNACLIRLLSYVPAEYGPERDPAPLYFNPEVQSLLKSLTRVNLDRVFRKRKLGDKALEIPTYKFMTDEQLQETIEEAKKRADELLQMPPVVQVRKPIDRIIVKDPALQGLDSSRHIFTDVSFGIKDSDRLIVIREPDGTLKEADWAVRDRMNQLYFPKPCRSLKMPRLFQEEYLSNLLSHKEYIFVLDRACTQFEPDNPDYQRVTSITYQHINDNDDFEILRSTRHFGPLAFYLTWFKNIDNLLLELIETAHIDNANNLLQLYGKIHSVQYNTQELQSLEGITEYIKTAAQKKGPLELAVQAYKDLERQRNELKQGIQVAHGLA